MFLIVEYRSFLGICRVFVLGLSEFEDVRACPFCRHQEERLAILRTQHGQSLLIDAGS